MAFENLDLKSAICFGWRPRFRSGVPVRSWCEIAEESITKGWRRVNVKALARDLAVNVDACYFYVAQGEFVDLDTGFTWRAVFVNDHMMWKLDLPGSPDAETLPEDADAFFKSEFFRKFAKRCGDLIDRARAEFTKTVEQHLEDGDLLEVDEVKLSRVMKDVDTKRFMENLRGCKYELE